MAAQGTLMEPLTQDASSSGAKLGLISVVIPVVERADDLLSVYHAFAHELEDRAPEYEFLFVFDGRFNPPEELAALSRKTPGVRILRFAREFGETAALRIGIEKSRGDLILTLPAYFQVLPQGLGLLLDAIESGADIAVANRSPRLDSWLNRMQSRAFHRMVGGVTNQQFHDMACGVRAMRRVVAESIPLYGDLHRFIPALALREGYRVEEVSVPQHPKDARTRVYRPGVYFRRILDIAAFFFLAKFTEKPLRFFGLIGSVFLAAGVVLNLVLLVQRVEGQGIANRPALLLAVLLLALGVQLIGLGLVGEIIVHLRAPHRRAYRVRERV
ncbi:MAG TPA: glycosyltransferase [Gemmatimonadales bacterium]|jgi:glycosyltransferase involved in cell wall biosynthesis|nr:glycosyltransferase [Gemmatimonadales bacterium]